MATLSTQPLLRKIIGSGARRFEDVFGDEDYIERFLGSTSVTFVKDVDVNHVLNSIIDVLRKLSTQFTFKDKVTNQNREEAMRKIVEFINLTMNSPVESSGKVRQTMLQELAKILNKECSAAIDVNWPTERLYSAITNFIVMVGYQSLNGLTYQLGSLAIMTARMKKMIDMLNSFVDGQADLEAPSKQAMKAILALMNHIVDASGGVLESNRKSIESIIQNKGGLDNLKEVLDGVKSATDDNKIRQMLKYYHAFMTIQDVREIAQRLGGQLGDQITQVISHHGLLSDNLYTHLLEMREQFKSKLSAKDYETWGDNIERLLAIITNKHYTGRKIRFDHHGKKPIRGGALKVLLNNQIRRRLKDDDTVFTPQRTIHKAREFSNEWDDFDEQMNAVVTNVVQIEDFSVDIQNALSDLKNQMSTLPSRTIIGIFAKAETQTLNANEKTLAVVSIMSIRKLGETLQRLAGLSKGNEFGKQCGIGADKCRQLADLFTTVLSKHTSTKPGELSLFRYSGAPDVLKSDSIKNPVLFTEVQIKGGSIIDKALQVVTDKSVMDTAAKLFFGGVSKRLSTNNSPGAVPLHMLIYPDGTTTNGRLAYVGMNIPSSVLSGIYGNSCGKPHRGRNLEGDEPESMADAMPDEVPYVPEDTPVTQGNEMPAADAHEALTGFESIESEFQELQGRAAKTPKKSANPVGRPKSAPSSKKLAVPQLSGLISYEDAGFIVGGRAAPHRNIDVILVPENTKDEHGFDKINKMATRLQYNIDMANKMSMLRVKDARDPESHVSAMVKSGIAGFRLDFKGCCDTIAPKITADYTECYDSWRGAILTNIHVFEAFELLTQQIKQIYISAATKGINLEIPNVPEDKFGENMAKYYESVAGHFKKRHNFSGGAAHADDTVDPIPEFIANNANTNTARTAAGVPSYSVVLSPKQTEDIIKVSKGATNLSPIDYLIYLLDELLSKAKKHGIDVLETQTHKSTINSCGLRMINALSVNFVKAKPVITMFADKEMEYVTKTADDGADFEQMLGEAAAATGTIADTNPYKELMAGNLGGTLDTVALTTQLAGGASDYTEGITSTFTFGNKATFADNAAGNYYPMVTGTPAEIAISGETTVVHNMSTLLLNGITALYGIVINGHMFVKTAMKRQQNRTTDTPLNPMVQLIFGNKAAAAGDKKDTKAAAKTYDTMEIMDIVDPENDWMIKSEIYNDIFAEGSKYRKIIADKPPTEWPNILRVMAFKFGIPKMKFLANKPPITGKSQPSRSKLNMFMSSADAMLTDTSGTASISLNQMEQLARAIVTAVTLKKLFVKMNGAIKETYPDANLVLVIEPNGLYSDVLFMLQSSLERMGLTSEAMSGDVKFDNYEDMSKLIVTLIRLINKTKAQGDKDTLNGLIQCFNKSIMVSNLGAHEVMKTRVNLRTGDYNPYATADYTIQSRLDRESYVPDNSLALFDAGDGTTTLTDKYKEMARQPDNFLDLYTVTMAMSREILAMMGDGSTKTNHIKQFGDKLRDAARDAMAANKNGLEALVQTTVFNIRESAIMEPIENICAVVIACMTTNYGNEVGNLVKMLTWMSPVARHTMINNDRAMYNGQGAATYDVRGNSRPQSDRYEVTALAAYGGTRPLLPTKTPVIGCDGDWENARTTRDVKDQRGAISAQEYFDGFDHMKDAMIALQHLAKLSDTVLTKGMSPQEYITRITGNFEWLKRLQAIYDINDAILNEDNGQRFAKLKGVYDGTGDPIKQLVEAMQSGTVETLGLRAFIDSCVEAIGSIPKFENNPVAAVGDITRFTKYMMATMFPHGDMRTLPSIIALDLNNNLDIVLLGIKRNYKNPTPSVNIHTLAHAGLHNLGGPLDRIYNQCPSVLEKLNKAVSNIARACMVTTSGTNTVTVTSDVFKGLLDVLRHHVSQHDTYPDFVTAGTESARFVKTPMVSAQEMKVEAITNLVPVLVDQNAVTYFDTTNPGGGGAAEIHAGLPQNGAVVCRSLLYYLTQVDQWMFDSEQPSTQVNVFMNNLSSMNPTVRKHLHLALVVAVQEIDQLRKDLCLIKYSLNNLTATDLALNWGRIDWALNFGASPNKNDTINDLIPLDAARSPHLRDILMAQNKSLCDFACALNDFAHGILDKISASEIDFTRMVPTESRNQVNPMPLVAPLTIYTRENYHLDADVVTGATKTVVPLVKNTGVAGSIDVSDKEQERGTMLRELNNQLANYAKSVAAMGMTKSLYKNQLDRIVATNPNQFTVDPANQLTAVNVTQTAGRIDLGATIYDVDASVHQNEKSIDDAIKAIQDKVRLSNNLVIRPPPPNQTANTRYVYMMSTETDATSGQAAWKVVVIPLPSGQADEWEGIIKKMHASITSILAMLLAAKRYLEIIKNKDNSDMYLQSMGFPPQFKYVKMDTPVGTKMRNMASSLMPLSPNVAASNMWYNTIMGSYFLRFGTGEQSSRVNKVFADIFKSTSSSTASMELMTTGVEHALTIMQGFNSHMQEKFTKYTLSQNAGVRALPNTSAYVRPITTLNAAGSASCLKEKVLVDAVSDVEEVQNALTTEIFRELGMSLVSIIRGIFGNDTNFPNILLNSSMFIDSTKTVVVRDLREEYPKMWKGLVSMDETTGFMSFSVKFLYLILKSMGEFEDGNNPRHINIPNLIRIINTTVPQGADTFTYNFNQIVETPQGTQYAFNRNADGDKTIKKGAHVMKANFDSLVPRMVLGPRAMMITSLAYVLKGRLIESM